MLIPKNSSAYCSECHRPAVDCMCEWIAYIKEDEDDSKNEDDVWGHGDFDREQRALKRDNRIRVYDYSCQRNRQRRTK